MAQVRLAGSGLDRDRRLAQVVVGAMHAALGRRLLVLLDCHCFLLNPARFVTRVASSGARARRRAMLRIPSSAGPRPPDPGPACGAPSAARAAPRLPPGPGRP